MERRSVYEWVRGKEWFNALQEEVKPKLKRITFGPSPPNLFVGEYGYPKVRAGPMLGLEEGIVDAPQELYGLNYSALIRNRAFLARGFNVSDVKLPKDELFWLAASQKRIDVEAEFTSVPKFDLSFSQYLQPMGPSGEVKKVRLAGNPKVPGKIESLIEEKLKVSEALPEIMDFDYNYVQKLLSAGVLGKERKMVPTKWSITATDDMLAREILKEVKNNASINDYRIYSNNYLHNHFEILLLPGPWEFEQFESFENSSNVEHEYEAYWGRTKYAETEGGGYYAGRYGVVEALQKLGKQARAIVFREVSPEYVLPVGVWQVRESVRDAFTSQPFKTSSFDDAALELQRRLKQPWTEYLKKSRILTQKKLSDY